MRKDIIENWASKQEINISDDQYNKLEIFQNHVLKVNESMNLTAIKDDVGFAIKHIIDSLTLLPYIPQGANVLDIGTGAGFTGVVLGIMRPDITLGLLDSLKKRIAFLEESLTMLDLENKNIQCLPYRAEELKGKKYDVCTARAVAKMDKLVKYSLPLVKHGGVLLAMKGSDITEEIEVAKKTIEKYSGSIKKIYTVNIADDITRNIVVVEKI